MAQTGEPTSALTSNEGIERDERNVNMAGVLQGLQDSLAQLAKNFRPTPFRAQRKISSNQMARRAT